MYSSLDRAGDFVMEMKDGSSMFVLTDHRRPEEIESTRDLSVTFVILRVLTASLAAQAKGGPAKIVYDLKLAPPEFFTQAVVSAGGVITLDTKDLDYAGPRAHPQLLLDGAMRSLGQSVGSKLGNPFTVEGMAEVERHYGATNPKDKFEVEYWTSVIETAAFAGEVVRGMKGGGWAVSDGRTSTLPAVYSVGDYTLNLTGKALKYFDDMESDSVAFLIKAAVEQMEKGGFTGKAPPPQPKPLHGAPTSQPGPQQGSASQKKKRLFDRLRGK